MSKKLNNTVEQKKPKGVVPPEKPAGFDDYFMYLYCGGDPSAPGAPPKPAGFDQYDGHLQQCCEAGYYAERLEMRRAWVETIRNARSNPAELAVLSKYRWLLDDAAIDALGI
jgi:hypothetical protein